MCIGNTGWHTIIYVERAVYPYVYREHNLMFRSVLDEAGLSLCV